MPHRASAAGWGRRHTEGRWRAPAAAGAVHQLRDAVQRAALGMVVPESGAGGERSASAGVRGRRGGEESGGKAEEGGRGRA